MALSRRSTHVLGGLAALTLSATGVFAATTASAKVDRTPQPLMSSSAVDLQGNPVDSRTYIGDTPPSDLGELQEQGSAQASPQPFTGTQ